jgi:hypothetical protein
MHPSSIRATWDSGVKASPAFSSPPIHRSIDSASTPLPPRQPDLVGIGCSINAVGDRIQIASIAPNGGCAQCGQIRVGDFITSIDGQMVTTIAACVPLIKGLPNTTVRLYIRRDFKLFEVVVARVAPSLQPASTASTPHATQPIQQSRQIPVPADVPSASRPSPTPSSSTRVTLSSLQEKVEQPQSSPSVPPAALSSTPRIPPLQPQAALAPMQPPPPVTQPAAPANVGIGVSISLAPSGAVQILSINPAGGAAATGQVFAGDIISKINGRALRTIEEARSLIPGPPGSECSLLLKRANSSGRNESVAVIVRRVSTTAAGGPAVGPSQAVTPQSPAAPSRDRSLYNTSNSVASATKSNKESPAQSQPPSRGDPHSTFGSSTSIAKSLDSASLSIGRSIDGGRSTDNRSSETGSPRGSTRGIKVANHPLSAFSTFSGDPAKAAGDSKASADKLAQDLRVLTLDLKMKMENDRDAQVALSSAATMTELRGSDLRKKDETIELLKQRIEEVTKSSDDLRRQSAQMSSRYTDTLQQVKALEAETLLLKQHVIEYQSQCEELAHGQRHALSKLTELDAENRLLKERLESPDSGRASQRGSQLGMRMDDSVDRKFYNDLHATLMASLVHTTTRPEVDQLGNHPDAIDPQKLISKALSMLQARIASSIGADAVSHAQADGAGTGSSSSSRVLSPPRGPNMHLQTRFTGAPASPSFVASRQSLQTPSSVISSQVKSTKHNSGFV